MDLLSLKGWTTKDIEKVIDSSLDIKKNPKKYQTKLKNKILVMILEKSSTRTRISFDAGMHQLGGHSITLDKNNSQLNIGADLKDEVRCIERYCDIIAARVLKHNALEEINRYSEKPIINLLSEKYHPCQALGDFLTIKEKLGSFKNKKLVYTGIGNNVSNSLIHATKLGMNVVLCVPEFHKPCFDQELIENAKQTGLLKITKDLVKEVGDADLIYTDSWIDIEYINNPKFRKEKQRRLKLLRPYQVNLDLIKNAKAKIMHCMPAHIGYEITREVIEHPNSIIFDQAENRLHAQKAILLKLLR